MESGGVEISSFRQKGQCWQGSTNGIIYNEISAVSVLIFCTLFLTRAGLESNTVWEMLSFNTCHFQPPYVAV